MRTDSTMRIVSALKRTSKSILILVFTTFLVGGCTERKGCTKEEAKIVDQSSGSINPHEIKLAMLFNFEWDKLYIVSGPRFPDEVTEMIGVNYHDVIPDDARQYIFVNKGRIVNDQRSSCQHLDYLLITQRKGFAEFDHDSSISILCKETEGELICRVQSQTIQD